MSKRAVFEHPKNYRVILRHSFEEDTYYGLDDFDARYLKIIQSKFGCKNSYHTMPDRVKMEMACYEWDANKEKFILNEDNTVKMQLNQLENMVISYSYA